MGAIAVRSNRWRAPLSAAWGPAILVVALLLPAPASAYPFLVGGFGDGSDIAQLSFDGLTTELMGPSLRLLTNGTVESASVEIAAAPGYLNSTAQDTSSADFAAGRLKDGIRVSAGTLSLDSGSSLIVLQASNSFGNATRSSVVINGSRMEVQTGSSGWFRTAGQAVPLTGWGVLRVFGSVPAGSSVQVDVLSPGGAPIVTNHSIGRPLDLDPVVYPTVLFRVTLTGVNASSTPSVDRVEIGQRFGDTPIGLGGGRATANVTASSNGDLIPTTIRTSFRRYSSNPVMASTAGTWYANTITTPFIIKIGPELWMYFAGRSTASDPWHVGRARSTDGTTWTIDSRPLLNGTSGQWDEHGAHLPYVIRNPLGSGYIMYYGTYNASSPWGATGRATSADGITWTKEASNPVLAPTGGSWDSVRTDLFAGVRYDAGVWTMWYGGSTFTGPVKVEMGLATSTDGVNWTKFSGNPVHPRSTSSFEAGDISWGHMLFDGATFYYYYSCNPSTYWEECLSTSTNGGYSWTKLGTVLPHVANTWEHNAGDAAVLLQNGSVLMIYIGWNSIWQFARADSVPNVASVRGQVDFGNYAPLILANSNLNAVLPAGSYANVFLSSSANGVSWSVWENVTSGVVSATPAQRFQRWSVDFQGAPGFFVPAFRGLTFSYTTYFARGTFESRAFSYAEPISGGALSASPLPSGGTVKFSLSNDDGISWTPVGGGTFAALPSGGATLIYRIDFEGGSSTSPVVDWANLTIQRRGFPENVTVRFGVSGLPFFAPPGAFGGGTNVSLPVDQLNAILNQTRSATPSATFVDTPFVVTSTHFGGVVLSRARVTFNFANPLDTSFSPPGSSLSMAENATQRFSVVANSPFAPVTIVWTVDDAEVIGARDQPAMDYAPDFASAGAHTVRCSVANGDTTHLQSWAVAVSNLNRAPLLLLSAPPSPFNVSHSAAFALSVTVQDLDGDQLAYAWAVDGRWIPETSARLGLAGIANGFHSANVTVTDGAAILVQSWQFEATDAAPAAVFDPRLDQVISHTAFVLFTVAATDADGDAIAYSWWLDGNAIASTGATYNLSHPATGTHRVEVRVTAAGQAVNFTWNVSATNGRPALVLRDPTAPITVPFGARPSFSITVEDPDGDTLSVQWTLDGLPVTGTLSDFTLPPDLAPGDHTIAYVAADPDGAKVTAEWLVTIRAPPTTSPGFIPGLQAWAVTLAMAATSTALFLTRRRAGFE